MDQRQRGLKARVHEVAVIGRELPGQHHALVDDGAGRHRDGVKFQDLLAADGEDAIGDNLSHNEKATLEIVFAGEVGGAPDKDLPHHRLDRLHPFAKAGIVDGHVAPAEHAEALRRNDLLDDLVNLTARCGAARHEELADRIVTRLRQVEAELGAFGGEERMRDLGQHAAAVAETTDLRPLRRDGRD